MKTKGIKLRRRASGSLYDAAESIDIALAHARNDDLEMAKLVSKSALSHIKRALKRLKMAGEKGRSYY